MSEGFVIAFDTSNEVIAAAVGRRQADGSIDLLAQENLPAHRASNTRLLDTLSRLCEQAGVSQEDIVLVAVGRGPGSFTGVRIALAALDVPLVGLSTLEAIAWKAWSSDVRGRLLVVGDAMRKEVYPAYFQLDGAGVQRLTEDRVVKAAEFACDIPESGIRLAGDGLSKYSDLFACKAQELSSELWTPTGEGLLLALQELIACPEAQQKASEVLPIYTRLSDAEEGERARLASTEERDLASGVQHPVAAPVQISPLSASFAAQAAALEKEVMRSDAWSAQAFADELVVPL